MGSSQGEQGSGMLEKPNISLLQINFKAADLEQKEPTRIRKLPVIVSL